MNIAEVIKGIECTIEGLNQIKNALVVEEVCDTPDPKATKSKSVERREAVQAEEPMTTDEEMKELEGAVGHFDPEQLKSMKYNEFKKLAASLGVKCTGTRDEIMERILALDVVIKDGEATIETEPEEVEEEVVEEKSSKSNKSTGSKKIGAKKADEPTRDEFDEQAEEIAKDTPVEDIIEALADVEIKANKKNAVQKLAEALREGLIGVDDDEEEEVEEEVDETPEVDEDEDGEEISADSYFPEYDPEGYNNPEEMTEERAEAVEAKVDEILTAYSDGELTDEDITSYIEDNASEKEIDLLGDDYTEEDLLKMYIELVKRTIDNDGEEHEQGEPYEVADNEFCCGRELKFSKKTKSYICEHCGTEYEAE